MRRRPRCASSRWRREGGAVPVLAVRVALDRELEVLERCTAGVRRGPAKSRQPVKLSGRSAAGKVNVVFGRRCRASSEARRRRVGVACGVGRAHLEGVRALAQAGVALRRAAGRPAAAVELALEGRAALGRREREVGAGRVGRVVRRAVDRRVRGCGVEVRDVREVGVLGGSRPVGRADADDVVAVGGEVAGRRRQATRRRFRSRCASFRCRRQRRCRSSTGCRRRA